MSYSLELTRVHTQLMGACTVGSQCVHVFPSGLRNEPVITCLGLRTSVSRRVIMGPCIQTAAGLSMQVPGLFQKKSSLRGGGISQRNSSWNLAFPQSLQETPRVPKFEDALSTTCVPDTGLVLRSQENVRKSTHKPRV